MSVIIFLDDPTFQAVNQRSDSAVTNLEENAPEYRGKSRKRNVDGIPAFEVYGVSLNLKMAKYFMKIVHGASSAWYIWDAPRVFSHVRVESHGAEKTLTDSVDICGKDNRARGDTALPDGAVQ